MASKVSGIIEQIQPGSSSGTKYAIASTAYGYCETAANESAKTVDMTGFKLIEGTTVHIKFQNGNTVLNPTLNIQSTGAKPIVFSSASKDFDGNFGWHGDEILTLTYDGTSWLTTNSAYATSAGYVSSGNIKPMYSKTYVTKLYSNPSSGDNYFQTVFNITPDTYDIIWEVKYRLTFTVSGHNDYNAIYDCSMSGRSQTLYSYHCYNSLVTYPIYYHCLYRGSSSSYPHEIGFRIASSYGDTTIQKTVKVDIIETINCTTSFFEDIKSYRNETITGYARTDISATSNGLQETGDNDTTGRDYSHSGYSVNGPDFRLAAYTLFGYDQNQKVQGISLYQAGYTSSTANLSTTRVYNTAGFAWEKGLWFTNNWTNYAPNANIDFSPAEFYYGLDLRYTDNVYLHKTTTSELGIVERKPLYFRGVIGGDGLFYLAPITVTHNNTTYQRVWTQDIPTSNDNYVYWLIGPAYYNSGYAASGYQVNLITENKLYWYHDGRFQEYLPHAVKADSVPLSGVTNATDLQAIENLSGNTGLLKKTAENTWTLDTSTYLTSHQTYTAFTGKPTGNQTPGFGSTFTIQQISQNTAGQVSGTDRTVTIPSTIATNSTIGLVKPWYSHSVASTGPTTGTNATAITVNTIQTTAGRYYAIESDSNGRLFVNVPWTNINENYLTSHNNLVKQTEKANTDSSNYKLLASAQVSPTGGTAYEAVYNANIYMDPSESGISAGRFTIHDDAASPAEKVWMKWNSTDQSLDFIFA